MNIIEYQKKKLVIQTDATIRSCAFVSIVSESIGICVDCSSAKLILLDSIAVHISAQIPTDAGSAFYCSQCQLTARRICVIDALSRLASAIFVRNSPSSADVDLMSVVLCDASTVPSSENLVSFLVNESSSIKRMNISSNHVSSKTVLRLAVPLTTLIGSCIIADNKQNTALVGCSARSENFRNMHFLRNELFTSGLLLSALVSTFTSSHFVDNMKPESILTFDFSDCDITECIFSGPSSLYYGVPTDNNKFNTITQFVPDGGLIKLKCHSFSFVFTSCKRNRLATMCLVLHGFLT